MKTAMEELIKELYYIQELPMVSGIIKRAELLVEKEKEQIMDAFSRGLGTELSDWENSEQYYERIYNKNK